MSDFGAVFATLWAAHDLADHVVQTDHQAQNKADTQALPYWPKRTPRHISGDRVLKRNEMKPGWVLPMAGHVGSYTAVQVAALAAIGLRVWRPRVLAAVAFSAATHAFIDRRWPVRWLLEHTGSPVFAQLSTPINGPYVADQALHHACLFITALIITGRP